jgi:hypothetical protein
MDVNFSNELTQKLDLNYISGNISTVLTFIYVTYSGEVAGFPPRRPVFDPGPSHMLFVMDRSARGSVEVKAI